MLAQQMCTLKFISAQKSGTILGKTFSHFFTIFSQHFPNFPIFFQFFLLFPKVFFRKIRKILRKIRKNEKTFSLKQPLIFVHFYILKYTSTTQTSRFCALDVLFKCTKCALYVHFSCIFSALFYFLCTQSALVPSLCPTGINIEYRFF